MALLTLTCDPVTGNPVTPDLLCPQVVKRLPKTRSGKIMRRILRTVAVGGATEPGGGATEPGGQAGALGDTSTLDDPSVVTEIIAAHARYKEEQKKKKKSS
jgi:acetyl-CoA synthetase